MIFLNRKKKGYGWYSTVNRDKKGDKVADIDVKYLDFSFTKGGEPLPDECNEFGSFVGDLFFRDEKTKEEYPVIPFVDDYYHSVCFKILKKAKEQPVYHPTTEPKWDLGNSFKISDIPADDIPFDDNPMRWE